MGGEVSFRIKHLFVLSGLLFSVFFFMVDSDVLGAEVASTLNPVGSGARATGMGGAFIGVADDATAASWNPAGLIQLEEPEISLVYSYFKRKQTYGSSSIVVSETNNSMDAEGLNYASIAFPFVLYDRNIVVSLNYQRLYEMDKDVSFDRFINFISEDRLASNHFKQEGFLYALSPAMAVQVLPQFYVGATLNLWDDYFGRNGWEATQFESFSGLAIGVVPFEYTDTRTEKVSFEGTNANFGFLWMMNDYFTLGGVYKTPFDADFQRRTTMRSTLDLPPNYTVTETETNEDLTLVMPASYGLGLSYRHSDRWMVAFDIYWTEWSNSVLRDGKGNETILIDGSSADDGRLKDTTQIRMGTEYLFIKGKNVFPIRFGIFYDPEPQVEHTDEYYGFSLGTGYARGILVFDISYQYRWGRDLTGELPAYLKSDVDVDQHTLMTSVILLF